jgi:mono/diheme cytochrome c family protein
MIKYLRNRFSACHKLRPITKILARVALVALLWAPGNAAFAQQEEVIENGQRLFDQKCAICHGSEGKGDGALGLQLKDRPADLSQLRKLNAGNFPFWQVYGKIDGREDIGAHGPGEMPIWGTDDRYEGTGGRLASGQILEIVFFLQSIQEE